MPSLTLNSQDLLNWHAQELAARRRIRNSLADWVAAAGYRPAAHHCLLLNELSSVATGKADRLMVLMPPGSAKSTYASVLYPAWWFTQHPNSSIIAASHTAELAEHFGRQVRTLIGEHGQRLGYSLTSDNRAAARWQISTRGQYFATGVNGPITGRRADLAIVDDPIRSYADVDSPSLREKLWNWMRSELVTRLKPHGKIILIMTRWHVDDLAGRLLNAQSQEWRVLRLPALAERDDCLGRSYGAPIWPEWESLESLNRKRLAVGERAWSALFQQDPRPLAGKLFKIDRIQIVRDLVSPLSGRVVRAWDLAATSQIGGNNPDWTVGLKMVRDQSGRFVVLDLVRLRGDPLEVEQAILRTAGLDGRDVVIGLPQDPGQAGKTQVTYLTSRLAGYRISISRESGAKITRAGPVIAQAEGGNLAVCLGSWNHAFLDELRDFPNGSKDDQVDALSRAFEMLLDGGTPTRALRTSLTSR